MREPESPVKIVHAVDSNAADSLGLRAEYRGNSLLLGWNRTSARVNAATSGVFIIADGAETRVLTLSPRELRNGGMLYKPAADDINVEFQIIEPRGRTTSESIRIIGTSAPVSPAGPIRQIARNVLPSQRRSRLCNRHPPGQISGPSGAVDAPAIDPEAAMHPPWFASGLMPLPPQPAPVESRPLSPVQSALKLPTGDAAAPAAPGFHAATGIRSPQPRVPQGVYVPQCAFDHPFEVKVEISINTASEVTDARVIDTTGPYASQLGPSALNTARAWNFHPAALAGQPVESTMVLTFRYSHAH